MEGQFASWWIPDEIVFLEEIPKTSVGKFLKRALREKSPQRSNKVNMHWFSKRRTV